MYLRIFWLLLLSIYKIFFLLNCVIYACWGISWQNFLESPLVPSLPLRLSRSTRRVPYLDDFKSTHFFNSLKFSSNRSGWTPDSGWDWSRVISKSLDEAKDDASLPWNNNEKDDDNNNNNYGDDTQLYQWNLFFFISNVRNFIRKANQIN